jgi:hypothetical protein
MTKPTLSGLALAACLLAAGWPAQAQHYAPGLEGIKAATLPPTGLYFRDYNYLYMADRYPGGPPDFDLTAYVQAPRIIYMTGWHPLGVDYGMDVIVPFAYTTVRTPAGRTCGFGLADISVEPVLFSKHFERFDVAVGYSFWAPTGEFSPNKPGCPGKGFWGHMITLGGTWYPDSEKLYSVSLLNRYELNHEQDQTGITPGNTDTLEFGVSRALTKTIEAGVIGYYQVQTTDDSGVGAGNNHDHIAGVGPEITLACPKTKILTSLRYAYEFEAKDRPQGHVLCLTLTRRF